ncbi:MAG: Transcriptional regulator, GntR family [uncultured Nocardioides sp.]|uniref:Transcriptional regulator, GntR family n=1 Tax=uncultured Nocardioides sp. TaxID=198441 RepID=A0A6J4P932_9ACTN|nr:MAG: Transcriptional regulator, GntR family [uncultured Nocardioides sp.]
MTVSTARSTGVMALLRAEILGGALLPGTPLRESSLAVRFDVSRRTVREALLSLSEHGLAVHRHNAGAVVRSFTAEDILDLYRVRRMLESEGVRSALTAPEPALAAVSKAFEAVEHAARGDSSTVLAEADMAFHGSVIALNGSVRIDEFYNRVATQMTYAIAILQRHEQGGSSQTEVIVAEHRAIRDAVVARDVYEAQRLVLDHIHIYERKLLAIAGEQRRSVSRRPAAEGRRRGSSPG